ncbi:RNA exonuclease 4 [Morus notabilis]|uniref:RNA exonuclease 4 n=1 Tax=Morus notabilis TaxID=981085 RepID=W9S0J7_9ROSA|nr:RNA exonuclease 4 [Morus notabilis]EXC20283.1 RNA exonuclease 4 [Morus notabilis]
MDSYIRETPETLRNKCAACFRQFNKLEHLVEHMRTSYHSVHEPACGICRKHCRSFESLREHLIGPLPKQECRNIFSTRGCRFCLAIFDSPYALRIHQDRCQLSGLNGSGVLGRLSNLGIRDNLAMDYSGRSTRGGAGPQVVALACKMVGGGSDGSLDICARVCLIDEFENIIFHSYVKPPIPVTNYRYETTGIRPEYLRDAMPVRQVQKKIQDFLCNGEPMWKIRPRSGGKARILVGHGLDHDLDRLQLEYPSVMIRDTAKYPPLMKTSKLSNSLKYLTQAYLGYDIQSGIQDPYEDCVATMRLYMRMRSQNHRVEDYPLASDPQNRNNFASWRQTELERMTPEQMLEISRSDYYCWCLDSN